VIPEGGDHVRRRPADDRDERAYHEINPEGLDYFLSVANPRPHKNILFSIRCLFGSEALRRRKVSYVLVGEQHPSVYAYAKDKDPENRIRFAGQVSEGLLRLLYERAVALVCPARGEGFCLPAVEAMQFGLPVIAANDGALPEVVGRSGLLLPLGDTHGWREAFERIFERRKQGAWDASPVIEQAGRFCWAATAKQTMALYEEVYRER
jgi:glycosyltransferase involved in cell wall biosynthesis